MTKEPFYARTDPYNPTLLPDDPGAHWQHLREHLLGAARCAAEFAHNAKPDDQSFIDTAQRSGLLHDLGKYQDGFQQMLRDAANGHIKKRTSHAPIGACHALQNAKHEAAFAVYGHHAGLHKAQAHKDLLKNASLATECLNRASEDHLDGIDEPWPAPTPLMNSSSNNDKKRMDLRIRMLSSCVIDADRCDCIRHELGALPTAKPLDASHRLDRLLKYIGGLAANCPDGPIKAGRRDALNACLDAAGTDGNMFALPLPTGAGKTLSSMAFALKRAKCFPERYRRVFVVVPFLSVIEQNAAVYAKALGKNAVVEHHSGELGSLDTMPRTEEGRKRSISENDGNETFQTADEKDLEKRLYDRPRDDLARENWDAPIIMTTTVRFFESLFSNAASDLRRLHNIARSIVILDEVQTLPKGFLAPLLSMMDALSRDFGVDFVFCTATQPAFEKPHEARDRDKRFEQGRILPIISPTLHARLSETFRRVIEPIWPSKDDTWSSERIAEEIEAEATERGTRSGRVLTIVNTKRLAADIFAQLRETTEYCWHLSTRMCAAHRLTTLETIKAHCKNTDLPCRLITTQLVEAGVDLDFPVVMRAMAPFDSIVQAAGRCDREGRETSRLGAPAGRLIVFEPEDNATPYRSQTDITRALLLDGLSLHTPKDVRRYFNRLYEDDQDPKNIDNLRLSFDFPEVSKQFHLIDDRTKAVLVPYGDGKQLMEELRSTQHIDRDIMRRAGRFQVGLYPHEFNLACELGIITRLWPEGDIWGCCMQENYDEYLGLILDRPGVTTAMM